MSTIMLIFYDKGLFIKYPVCNSYLLLKEFSMAKAVNFIILVICILIGLHASAQNFTGSWEGKLGSEILQINVEQKNGAICGYTHDVEIYDKSSFCSAKFTGSYLFDERKWYLQGYEFITRSSSHVFMNIKIWFDPSDPPNVLRASVTQQNVSLRMHDIFSEEVFLERKSKKPVPYAGQKGSCFDEIKDKPSPEKDKSIVVSKKPVTPVPPVKKDSVKIVTPKKPETTNQPLKKDSIISRPKKIEESSDKIKNMEARKKSEQSRLVVHSKNLVLKLYDNGVVDGDIISVFYNGKLLVANQKLSTKAIELDITLDENVSVHEITLYAENLGEIPPNTALIIVTAGKQRFELRSKANLEENAVLIFEYKPLE